MQLTLTRISTSDQGTKGRLVGTGIDLCTLELPWRDNIRQKSCIYPGVYRCLPHYSARLGQVYWLQDVPGRDAVYIHVGNFAGDVDKGWASDVQGCILVGLSHDTLVSAKRGKMQDAVISSRTAMQTLMGIIDKGSFNLEIIDHVTGAGDYVV